MTNSVPDLTVPAVVAGPMGRAYLRRPCGHGRWALPNGETLFVRSCSACKARWEITFHLDTETADLKEIVSHEHDRT